MQSALQRQSCAVRTHVALPVPGRSVESKRANHCSAVQEAAKTSNAGPCVSALAAIFLLSAPSSLAKDTFSSSEPVYDGAGIVPSERKAELSESLRSLERDTGWRVRVYTNYGAGSAPRLEELRSTWTLDKKTMVLQYDPSSPSILNPYYLGDDVFTKLRRSFWVELQSRYGNLFYVREEGESAAVLNSLEAVRTCLRQPEGCTVVPGLTSDEYGFTLLVSAAAGLVAGATVRIEPQGFIQRRFVWALIFSPLWGTLFFNLALGPVRVRTDDLAPVLGNTAAFLAAALLLWLGPELLGGQQKRAE